MLTMTEVHDLRKLYYDEGKNITEISKKTGRDRKTVRQSLKKRPKCLLVENLIFTLINKFAIT